MSGDRGKPKPEQSGRGARRGGARALSEEERSLWEVVAKSVRRSFNAGKVAPAANESDTPPSQRAGLKPPGAPKPKKSTSPPPTAKRSVRPTGGAEPFTRVQSGAAPIDPLGRVTPGLDRRTSRRLSRGEAPPEARLDLHGMSAERAHAELIRFIQGQFAVGSRCVLVITGKGGRGQGSLNGWRSEPVGVLKTMTPEWLRQPPLSGLVTNVFQAHRRHGGEGALYVYLRKNR